MKNTGSMSTDSTIRSGERISLEKKFSVRFKKILAVCDALLNCKNIKVSDNNLFIEAAVNGVTVQFAAFAITTLGDSDFFTARLLSNLRLVAGVPTMDIGSTDIKIAKSPLTRRSVTADKIDGFTITYTNLGADHDNNRNANDGSSPIEEQCVYPRYITLATLGFTTTVRTNAQCVIYACQTGSTAGVLDAEGNALDWIELLPSRVWAKRFL